MIEEHFTALADSASRASRYARSIDSWGRHLATVLESGGRLLACGNGGSAAEVQHLTGELAGRFLHDRSPYAAIPLHADTSAFTAILNDYGEQEVFARGVRAHGRPGDVLIALSTSGRSQNVIAAVKTANEIGMRTWALTGPAPNTLAAVCDDAVAVQAPSPATVQEMHLALIHALCAVFDEVAGARQEERSAVR
ncbi:D-sedoheptulose 7-phosphate isomerase [Saccharopolyspora erythraea NRRL 2338]|uniref:Sugar isomerase n=2 Tax=Saccharopolyspora erythraea TaxID=1836 RepID=A4FL31_SACEN|nr:SIS domain-containing protein [Saccharopolyspora erythraea]EQD82405.1 phosphoheptose isomerase [Saccharopolyspora erythraea D]PFG98396.1 D-sedoheptulose 7-phosphate isomerase [Saccharopolyspora erythraea NRRL 2338]QRK88464.1 SIS domain-containing protein [Saccharopolyspora erythraea]CAM04756.1 putative sugar isomerase [Saccharopolyspora erythraea NRRL 2338]